MRCDRCGYYPYTSRRCKACFYEPKMEWWEWLLLLLVFGGLVVGGYYEVL